MAIYVRMKRAMDPLDDDAKARLRGHGYNDSSGSGSDHEPMSCLLHDFFLDAGDAADSRPGTGVDFSGDEDEGDGIGRMVEEIRELLAACEGDGDLFRLRLVNDVTDAAETLAGLQSDASAYRRAVMARLREGGYDAGLCKAKWQGSAKLVGGSYEYINVVASPAGNNGHGEQRYIIDLAFAAEFEVARAAAEYRRLVSALPVLMVARAEDVRQMVRVAARAARWSLKSRDLHVPPWRKERYMTAKWLGPYRRTVNAISASTAREPMSSLKTGGRIICRATGFAAMDTFVSLPATRIR